MPETEALERNVKKIRTKMKQTQLDFSLSCGISEEELSLIERQKTDPKPSTLKNIAAYTDLTVSELLQIDKTFK